MVTTLYSYLSLNSKQGLRFIVNFRFENGKRIP